MTDKEKLHFVLLCCEDHIKECERNMNFHRDTGNIALAEWFEGKARAYKNVIRMIKEDY